MSEALFEPRGTVFSATRISIPVADMEPPSVLAYVDLDEGPRVLARWETASAPAGGTRTRVAVVDGVVEAREER